MPLLQLRSPSGVRFRRGGSADAYPALASRDPDPDHYPHTAVLALSESPMSVTTAETAYIPARAGLSWGAIFGGAAVATAVTIMLLALGSGLGLASVSPIRGGNPSAVTFTALAAVWLIVVQWVSSFFGGYLAGRLRPGWAGVHRDEVMFRDTASGFVAWAVASIFVVAVVASGTSSLLGGAGRAAAAVASSAAGGLAQSAGTAPRDPSGYLLDVLFRPSQPSSQANSTRRKGGGGPHPGRQRDEWRQQGGSRLPGAARCRTNRPLSGRRWHTCRSGHRQGEAGGGPSQAGCQCCPQGGFVIRDLHLLLDADWRVHRLRRRRDWRAATRRVLTAAAPCEASGRRSGRLFRRVRLCGRRKSWIRTDPRRDDAAPTSSLGIRGRIGACSAGEIASTCAVPRPAAS